MSKRYSIFLCVMFCLFIGVFAVAHLALPDREFSENENKSLELMPTLKAEDFKLSFPSLKESGDFFNGKFMSKFETYFTDQFPLRDPFITIKAACELAVGKTVNNDVYFGRDDTLFAGVAKPEEGEVDKRLEYVEQLAENLGKLNIPTYFSLVPNKLNINGDLLMDPVAGTPFAKDDPLALSVNYLGEDMWQKAAAMTHANWVDMFGLFEEHADEELFYRTDHHWTSLGAYYGYVALMEGMGLEPVSLDEYEKTTVSDSFLGTTYSSSGAGWVKPDSIDIYVPEEGVNVVSYFKGAPEESELYVEEKLEIKDKYTYFMGGNTPLAVITTEHIDAPKVLVIRDSYSDSLAPFLTENFSEIHLFDLRYNNTPVPMYAAQNEFDAVVVLYSTANFLTDGNLFKMSRG